MTSIVDILEAHRREELLVTIYGIQQKWQSSEYLRQVDIAESEGMPCADDLDGHLRIVRYVGSLAKIIQSGPGMIEANHLVYLRSIVWPFCRPEEAVHYLFELERIVQGTYRTTIHGTALWYDISSGRSVPATLPKQLMILELVPEE